jgi:hypothetical protein
MPRSAEDILLEILIQRRQLQDELSWEVPAMMLLAESFILLVALNGSSNIARIIASGVGIIVGSIAILSLDRLKNGELFDTSVLNKIITKISIDDVNRGAPTAVTATDSTDGKTIYRAPETSPDNLVDHTMYRAVIGDEYHTKRANYYTSREYSGVRMFFANYTGNIGWIFCYVFFIMAFIVILVLASIQYDDESKNYF